MLLKFKENRIKGSWDRWTIFSNILNVYHHLITEEAYLELCREDDIHPFDYQVVEDNTKSVRVIHCTRKNGSSLTIALGNRTAYLLNEDGKTIEKII